MKKIILSFILFAFFQNVNAQCPSYDAAPSSATEACSNQPLYFSILNTDCPGVTSFTVSGNSGSSWGSEITWEVVNTTTNAVVASGGPYTDGIDTPISVVVGPNDPNIEGTSYNLIVYDAFGDGFDADGSISIVGSVNPVSISGDFGTETNAGFSVPVAVDDVNYSITTSGGTTTGVLTSCSDFLQTLTFDNPSFCTTTTETVTWLLTCASDGSTLSSGSQDITVYPSLPTSAADLVAITWDAVACAYDVVPADCAVGSVFTISPDPAALPPYAVAGTETFTITYTGIAGGPDCCSTGGPAVPLTFVTPAPSTSAVATNSPFNTPVVAPANAAYLTTGPAGSGGTAVSGSFDVSVTGYSYPEPNWGGSPCDQGDDSYWVTIYVDGAVISDVNYPAGDMTITVTLAQISAAGVTFDENSVIEVYVYPNSFSGFDACPTASANATQTTYLGSGASPVAVGEWTGSAEISDVLFSFTELVPSAADCDFTTDVAYTVCSSCPAAPAAVDDAATVCSGAGTGTFAAWQTAQAAAVAAVDNATTVSTVEYSTAMPTAAVPATGNTTVTGTIPAGCASVNQAITAYMRCDSGTAADATDDVWTAIGTYTLTVNPAVQAGTVAAPSGCSVTVTKACASDVMAASAPTGGAVAANFNATTGVYTAAAGAAAGTLTITFSNATGCGTPTLVIDTPACAAGCAASSTMIWSNP